MTDSRKVAKVFGKQHRHVLRDIRNLVEKLPEEDRCKFGPISIPDGYGRLQPAFEMDRDGFTLLAMGFEGDKALKFKLDYIAAFNAMEEELLKRFAPAAPKSELEILLGAVNGLVAQDKRLKELEAKTTRADEKNKALEEKVSEIDHVFHTNGCAKGFIPLKDARMTYGNGLSLEMFVKVMRFFDQTIAPYRYQRPDGEWGQGDGFWLHGTYRGEGYSESRF